MIVVSAAFEGVALIERHRLVNEALAEELAEKGPIHALSIKAKTPEQWSKKPIIAASPACLGGIRA